MTAGPRSPLTIGVNSPLLSGPDAAGAVRQRVRAIVPDVRFVSVSSEGLSDEPLDEIEVLLRGWTLGDDALDRVAGRAPHLRWIHSVAVGVEHVLTPVVRLRGITVTNGRGVYSRPIAEYVLTMILAVCRRLPQLLELQRERTWQPIEAVELAETTVGLVGIGSIGGEVARLLAPFGARIVAVRRGTASGAGDSGSGASPAAPDGVEVLGGLDRLPELLAVSDFVVLALPLTPATESVIDDEALAGMKPGSWLINIARGGLVDERALARALRDGPMGGAILDAFRQEPLSEASPLYLLPNCIVTPHTSWASSQVLGRSIDLFCENVRRYVAGERLLYVVDPEAGY